MKYFITGAERQHTCYHEFYRGKWDKISFWKEESILLDDDMLSVCGDFFRALQMVIPSYDPFGETEVTYSQWKEIGRLLETAEESSRELYAEADRWAEKTFALYNCFTILGI